MHVSAPAIAICICQCFSFCFHAYLELFLDSHFVIIVINIIFKVAVLYMHS